MRDKKLIYTVLFILLSILILGTGLVSAVDLTNTNEKIDNANGRVDWALERADNATVRVDSALERVDNASSRVDNATGMVDWAINKGINASFNIDNASSKIDNALERVNEVNNKINETISNYTTKLDDATSQLNSALNIIENVNTRANDEVEKINNIIGAYDSTSAGTFTDLQNDINNGVLSFTRNYKYNSASDSGLTSISFNTPNVVLDFNGHIIDFSSNNVYLNIMGDNITFKNAILINYNGGTNGALYWSGTSGKLINSTFFDCRATNSGGGLYWNGANGNLSGTCVFINCRATYLGGGLVWNANYGNLSGDCVFVNCIANNGAGVYWSGGSGVLGGNCVFIGCSATISGGGIYWNGQYGNLSGDCVFFNCCAGLNKDYRGGGLYWGGNSGTLSGDCVFFNCSSRYGALNWAGSNGNLSGDCVFINCRAINDNGGALHWIGANGNLSGDCVFFNCTATNVAGGIYWGIGTYCVLSGDCVFINCSASTGAAIYYDGSFDTLSGDCVFINCRATKNGGAIYWDSGSANLSGNCIFINCIASMGGGLYFNSLGGVLTGNCSFVNCSATQQGGGLYWNRNYGNLSDCIFINCSANSGAGVYWYGNYGNLSDCIFINCRATQSGGAMVWKGDYGNLIGSIFVNCSNTWQGGGISWFGNYGNLSGDCVFINCSSNYGGAIYWYGQYCNVSGNCSFVNCSATGNGGGIYWDQQNGVLSGSSVFIYCSANYGGGIYWNQQNGVLSGSSVFIYCSSNYGGGLYWFGSYGNLSGNCSFVNCSASQYGGGIYWNGASGNFNGASNFTNCSANYGSAIYWNTESYLDLGNFTFVDNKASASLSAPSSRFLYSATLTGGDNILNAVYNTKSSSFISVNGTTISDTPTLDNVYQSNCLFNQSVNITVYGDNNKVLDSVVAYSDLNGTVRYYALNGTKVNFTHFESSLYRYATASTIVSANVSISASIDNNILVDDDGVLNVTLIVKGVSYSFGGNITVNSSFLNTTVKYTGGTLSIPFTAPFVGVYPINITYSDDDLIINTTLNLTSVGWNPEVFAYVHDIIYGESLNISLNTSISNVTGKVQYFDANGNLINTTSINEGFTYTPSTTGLQIIRMVYSGDNYYRSETVYRSFMVYMFSTNISANDGVINLGESFTISPNITEGASGNVYIDGSILSIGEDYIFTPSRSGVYNILIEYGGDGLYSPANTTVHVIVRDVFLNATVNSTTVVIGENVSINTSVFNNESNLITNGSVTFIFDDGTVSKVMGPGESLIYTPLSTGVHRVLFIYDGEDVNIGKNSILTLNVVDVSLINVNLNTTINSTSILYNESVLLNTSVFNGNNLVTVGNVTYIFDDGTESVIKNIGETLVYKPLSIGNHSIIIVFNDTSGVYNSNYTSLYLYVSKLNSTLNANNGSILLNESYTISPNLTSGASGYIYLNGVRISVGENYTFTTKKPGNYTINIIYDGDDYYNPSNTSIIIEVNDTTPLNANLTVSINSTNILYGESVLLNTSLLDSEGKPIVGTVSFIFDDGTISQNLRVGETYTYTPQSTGTRTILVEYKDASGVYASNSSVLYLYVNKLNTTLSAFNGSILLGESFIISPNLTNGASGRIIVDGANIPVNGSYTLTPKRAGNYTILIEYLGDEIYNPSNTTILLEVNETLIIPVFLNATLNTSVINIHDSVLVNLTVFDNESNTIDTGFVSYISDDGLVDITHPLGESIVYTPSVAGVHTIIVTYNGNGTYGNRLAILTLNVLKINPNLTPGASNILYGESSSLSLNSTNTNITGIVNYYTLTHTLIASSNINEGITYTPSSTGLCTVIMEYSGDENYEASTVYISFNVSKLNSTISVSNVSILDNESYTFTPTLTPGASGFVFIDGVFIPINGSYTFTPTSPGNYTLSIVYDGDDYFNPSSTIVYIEVNDTTPLNVDLEVMSNSTNILFNESVLLNTSLLNINIGSVTFIFDDGTEFEVKNLGESLIYKPLSVGNHTILVKYSDSSNTYANTSKVLHIYVNKLNSTLSVSNASILDTESYIFIPTLTPGATGYVFIDGVRFNLGEAYTFTPTSPGNYTLSIVYDGDDYFNPSSTIVYIEVNDTTPLNVDLEVLSNSTSILYGESVLLNTTVLVDSGSLRYYFDNGENITASISDGVVYTPNSIGVHTVLVEYIDTTGKYQNTSSSITILVNKLDSVITVTDGVINLSDSYTFTPTLTSGATGYVFIEGVRFNLGEAYTFTPTSPGNYTLTIVYDGDDYYNPSNTTVNILVLDNSPLNVNLEVKSNSTSILYGDSVLLNTNVYNNGNLVDSGSLTYYFDNGENITVSINNPVLYTPNSIGVHTVLVEYSDTTGKYQNASSSINILVNKLDSVVIVAGATISLNEVFNITPITTPDATGYVFVDGVRIPVNGTYTFIPTRTGTYILNVRYDGDEVYNPSNTTVRIIVVDIVLIDVNLNISVNTTSISYNESLSLDVTVIGDDDEIITDGNLTYTFDDGTESITLPIGETLNYTPLSPGNHSISISYPGSNVYNSELTSVNVIVNKLNSTTTANNASILIGESYTITPTITSGATGTVIVNGISLSVGTNYTFTPSNPGEYSINIEYLGDNIFNPSNTTINIIVIDDALINVTVIGFINTSTILYGETVLLNASVYDNESNLVTIGSLTYYFDDGTESITVPVGETVTYTPKFTASNNITISYTDSTGVYNTNFTSLNIGVSKLNSTVSGNDTNITIGESLNISPVLTDGATGTILVNGVSILVGESYTFTPTSIGTYNISIIYLGDNVFNPSNTTITVIVLDDMLKDVSIELSSNTTSLNIGESVLLNTTVYDNESNPITIGNLTYYFDDGFDSITVPVGDVVLYTPKTTGNHTVIVVYHDSTGVYNTNTTILNLEITKLNSTVSASNTTILINGSYTITPTITSGATGTLIVNGVSIPVGETYTFIPTSPGVYNLNIQYLGDNIFNPSNTTIQVIVLGNLLKNITISVYSNSSSLILGESVLLNTTVLDNESNPITIGSLTYLFDDGTDSITVPIGENVLYNPKFTGNHSITVVYTESLNLFNTLNNIKPSSLLLGLPRLTDTLSTGVIYTESISSASNTGSISIDVDVTKLNSTVSANNGSINLTESYTITPVVTDGATGTILVNGVSIQVGGSYIFTPSSAGIYTINIEYLGDSKYNPSNTTILVLVSDIETTGEGVTISPSISNENIIFSETVILNATVFDNTGNIVSIGSLTYLFDDETNITVAVGETVSYTPKTTGNHSITIIYTDSTGTYGTNITSLNLEVSKLNSTVTASNGSICVNESFTILPNITTGATGTILVNGVSIPVNEPYIFRTSTPGTYNISIIYLGDNIYEASNTTIQVIVYEEGANLINTSINTSDLEISYNETLILNLTVFDSTSNIVLNGSLTYLFDDGRIVTVSIGELVNYSPKFTGNHTVTVKYNDETGVYRESINSFNILVNKLNSTVEAFNTTINLTESYIITPTVTEGATGTLIVNGLNINIGDSYIFTPTSPGTYTISIEYLGDSVFNPSSTTIQVTVLENKTPELINTTISVLDLETYYNETIVLNLTVFDSTGIVLNGSLTYIFDDGETITVSVGEEVLYTLSSVGNHTVIVKYNNTDIYKNSDNTFNILVNKLNSTVVGVNGTVNIGGSYSIPIILTPGATGSVIVNGAIVNISSSYIFTSFEPGVYVLDIQYLGDNIYEASNTTVTVIVVDNRPKDTSIDTSNITDTVLYNTTVSFNLTVYSNGSSVDVGSLTYAFDDGVVITVNIGEVAEYTFNSTGNHSVSVFYSDTTGLFKNSRAGFNILVNKLNSTLSASGTTIALGESYTFTPTLTPGATGTLIVNGVSIPVDTNYTFTPTSVGIYVLSIEYIGDEVYNPSNTTITVFVLDGSKISAELNINTTSSSIFYDGTILLNTTIFDNISSSYVKGNITYTFDDGTESVTIPTGEVYEYHPKSADNHTIFVSYSGNNVYEALTGNTSIYVSKIPTTISANGGTVSIGSSIDIIPVLTPGATGIIFVDDVGIRVGGIYQFIGTKTGTYQITILYEGDEYYAPSSTSVSVTVTGSTPSPTPISKKDTSLTVEVLNETLEVSLTDSTGALLTNKVVSIISPTKTLNYLTDNNGKFTVNYNDLGEGEYNIVLKYNGDENTNPTSTIQKLSIPSILKKNTTINITNKENNLEISLNDNEGVLANKTIKVSLNNETKEYILDENGKVQLNLSNLKPGTYTLTVTYPGDKSRNPGVKTYTFTIPVIDDGTSLKANFNGTLVYGDTNGLIGTLSTYSGKALAGHHIAINVSRLSNGQSKVYWVTTDYNGKFILPINLAPGEYSLEAIYYGEEGNKANRTGLMYFNISQNKINTILNVNEYHDVTGKYLTGKLTNSNGLGLSNQVINIELSKGSKSKVYTVLTNNNGEFSLAINLVSGFYNVKCSYTPSAIYGKSESSTTMTIL